MRFESESEMKSVAKDSLGNVFDQNALEVVPEFDYGPGRTDLVLVNVSDAYWGRRIDRLKLTEPIRKKTHLQTFLQLHGRGEITEEYFDEIGALSQRHKRNALNWLVSSGFVDRNGNKIKTANNLRKHITTAIGVELKLRKWKDALKQAHRGRSFADYRYVALDEDHIEAALENLNMFRESNVGLISINEDGGCTKHFEPNRINPYSNLNRWKLNEVSLQKRLTSCNQD